MNNSKSISQKQTRKLAFKLRSTSQSILRRGHRVHVCQKLASYNVLNGSGDVGLSRSKSSGNAHFHGFAVCGDVHACPVCRNKIGEVRVNEILSVLGWHRVFNDGIALLATFTARHDKTDILTDIVSCMSEAKRLFSSLAAVKNAKLVLGYNNMISGRDLTHGHVNGWHPHYHDIWLISGSAFKSSYFKQLPEKLQRFALKNDLLTQGSALSIVSIKKFLSKQWAKCCVKAGLKEPSESRGFDLLWRKDGSDAVGAYVSKWARELASSHKKQGKNGSRTPFQILSDLSNGFKLSDAKLWIEYTDAYYGKSMVFFGRGLKEAAGLKDITDDEAALNELPDHICNFTKEQYQAIIVYSAYGTVLDIADNYPVQMIYDFVNSLVAKRNNENVNYNIYMANLKRSIFINTEQHLIELGLAA
jgi:hypothetical protein